MCVILVGFFLLVALATADCFEETSLLTMQKISTAKKICTSENQDPWQTGSEVACCSGLEACLAPWTGPSSWGYKCLPSCQIQESDCLCMFDIDRTLTAKQGQAGECPGSQELPGIWDAGYGGGTATLSAFAAAGVNASFCKGCYLGICSAGTGSGIGSSWNNYILDSIMRNSVQDRFTALAPGVKSYFWGVYDASPISVTSPYVLHQGDGEKQNAVEQVRQWYKSSFNISIEKSNVHFYDDRTNNIPPFATLDLPAKQISCTSRDWSVDNGIIGLCGAQLDEIIKVEDNQPCSSEQLR
mmetsp:Transcript_102478/g.182048  ORF Transcript_102478/g.182048 Transcript_102478/m.182048 type:complete len:299 (+) Transcript_102478:66-962(+)|eukprot:CAMPEP_0197655954 /NCGR_PEP_ID=MMETSP1338-20131121/39774_1 /TAXON_ID=43686 ORGANISM="Pelagodinium beii, Strain RCC1491" /NCGR_SAMPLE_ID=MMETSP1338 /ASSEMBLY_ACC=CAM_ASM_000754 /LENGTH=298 /DNA_ID=CAMNT_0043231713 /DNA_START=44 /DNA_END=940 /DNA_ORIENTATION=-